MLIMFIVLILKVLEKHDNKYLFEYYDSYRQIDFW